MILGGPQGEASVGAVEDVFRGAGFDGSCTADLHAQGGGTWIVLIELVPEAFIGGISAAAGADAWKRLKRLMEELRDALGREEGSHGQLYVRPDVVTRKEWEASKPHGPMPGFPKPGTEHEQLQIDTLWSDDEYQALFEPGSDG
jgi:hypothetical protein